MESRQTQQFETLLADLDVIRESAGYPSALQAAGTLKRYATSLHETGLIASTHLDQALHAIDRSLAEH